MAIKVVRQSVKESFPISIQTTNMSATAATFTAFKIAPIIPFICQPIKVAVDKTGPGVICPTATASISTCLVNQPLATNSESRKAIKHNHYHKE